MLWFNFKHYNIRDISVFVNGESVSPPIRLNFTSGDYLDGYRSLFSATGKINRDEDIALTSEYSDGYSLFGFDLSPALCNGGHQEPARKGSLRISLEFAAALPNTVTVLLYSDFDNEICVNKVRKRLLINTMNTRELECVLDKDSIMKLFHPKVYAIDQFMKHVKYNKHGIYICRSNHHLRREVISF